MPIIFNSRHTAQQQVHGNQRVVKCQGGYIIMSARQYQIWKRQR